MLRRLNFTLVQAVVSMLRAPIVQLIAISTIGAAVMVFCLLQVVTNTVAHFAGNFSGQVGIVVFIKPDVPQSELNELLDLARTQPQVSQALLVKPEDALEELRDSIGAERIHLEDIDPAVLPVSIQIELEDAHDQSERQSVVDVLKGHHLAENIHTLDDGSQVASRLDSMTEMVRFFGGLVALLVTVAVLFVISNTMRLAIHARQKEIEIMQWVGASELFIRLPFYIEGAVQGILSSLVAVFSTRLTVELAPEFMSSMPSDLGRFKLQPLTESFELSLIITLCFVGIIASHLATQRYFKKQTRLWF